VTRVQGVTVPDPDSDETETNQDPTSGIMLTIALSTHDVERWVWFTEGEDHDYANMWLTLQTDATDTSGSFRVDLGNVWP
jgi:pilus assembly protein CpaB